MKRKIALAVSSTLLCASILSGCASATPVDKYLRSFDKGDSEAASQIYSEEIKDWYAPSGTYELLVGHASDDIRVSCEIQFTTKKLLPFQVTGATTIGELLADSRTAAATMELLAPLQQTGENGEEISEADQQMIQAILEGLPLKSLSIAGVSGEMIEEIIHKLNELC